MSRPRKDGSSLIPPIGRSERRRGLQFLRDAETLAKLSEPTQARCEQPGSLRTAVSPSWDRSPLPGQGIGVEGIRDRYTMLFDAFDFRFEVDDVIAEDDKVALRWTQTGTHVGPLFGMPPTNRSSRTIGIEIWRVEDGKLAEHRDVVDVFGQFMQPGLIPQATGSPA